jgi:radical SAM protein with 4Fe4S-binding SPASM domain
MFACGKRLKNELTKEELFELINILREVRCPELRITGGEPVIRKDLFEVTKKAKEIGLYVMLNTNGIYGKKIWYQLISSGIDEIIISLEGDEPEHDKRRGTGAFMHVMKTIAFLAKFNKTAPGKDKIKLTLNQTFGRSNVKDFEFVVRLAARVGADVNLMPLRPFGTTKVRLIDDMLTPEEFRDFMEQVMRMRVNPEIVNSGIRIISKNFDLFADYPGAAHLPKPFDKSSCGASGLGLGINSDGEIDVCGFLSKIPGFYGPNILKMPFYHVWMSPKIHSFRTVVKRYCEQCTYYRKQCVGACKAMAYAETGDLGGRDRYCFAHLIKH